MRLIVGAGVALLVAACASAPVTPPASERPTASSSVAVATPTEPSATPSATPERSLANTAPSVTPEPDATPVWGYVDTGVPTPSDDFVPSDQAYFFIGAGDWIRVWVGAPASAPDHGIVLFHRAPIVAGQPDMLRDRETRFDLPLTRGPWMITGVLDNGVLALQSGDGSARSVGLDLATLAMVPAHASPARIVCGALASPDCRAVLDAILDRTSDVIARIIPPVCHSTRCPTSAPSELVVGVSLQPIKGGPTSMLTCLRTTAADPVQCEPVLPVRG